MTTATEERRREARERSAQWRRDNAARVKQYNGNRPHEDSNDARRDGSGVVNGETVVLDADSVRSLIADGEITVTADQWAKVNGFDPLTRTYRHGEAD